MELRQLKYFVTVASTLNFSEAARRLYITQGTLSQQIKQLEYELGSDLLERTSHSVQLTEAGEVLLPLAQRMLSTADTCTLTMRDLRSALTGELRIGVSPSHRAMVANAARQFMREHSGVLLKIFCKPATELSNMLRDGSLDFIVIFRGHEADGDLDTQVLQTSALSIVMSRYHALADRKALTYGDLIPHSLVLPGSGLLARRAFERYYGVDAEPLNVRAIVSDTDTMLRMIKDTELLGVVSDLEMIDENSFVAVPLVGYEPVSEMVTCVQRLRTAYRKRAIDAFISLL